MPIADSLTVSGDMEGALTAYLADELSVPAGEGEMAYWRGGATADGLKPPLAARPAHFVTGAPELAAALAGVGVVESASEARVMQPSLLPGQALTTGEGGLWRWDGFVRRAAARDGGAEAFASASGCEGELVTATAEDSLLSEKSEAAEAAVEKPQKCRWPAAPPPARQTLILPQHGVKTKLQTSSDNSEIARLS